MAEERGNNQTPVERASTIPLGTLQQLCEKGCTEIQKRYEAIVKLDMDPRVQKFLQEIIDEVKDGVSKLIGNIPEEGITDLESQEVFCSKLDAIVSKAKKEITDDFKSRDGRSGKAASAHHNIVRTHLSQTLSEAREEIRQHYELKSSKSNRGSSAKEEKENFGKYLEEKLVLLSCKLGAGSIIEIFNEKNTQENPDFYEQALKIILPLLHNLRVMIRESVDLEVQVGGLGENHWSAKGLCEKLSGKIRYFLANAEIENPSNEEGKKLLTKLLGQLEKLADKLAEIGNNRQFRMATSENDKSEYEAIKAIIDKTLVNPAEFFVALRDQNIKKHKGFSASTIKFEKLPPTISGPLLQLLEDFRTKDGLYEIPHDERPELYATEFNSEHVVGGASLVLPVDITRILSDLNTCNQGDVEKRNVLKKKLGKIFETVAGTIMRTARFGVVSLKQERAERAFIPVSKKEYTGIVAAMEPLKKAILDLCVTENDVEGEVRKTITDQLPKIIEQMQLIGISITEEFISDILSRTPIKIEENSDRENDETQDKEIAELALQALLLEQIREPENFAKGLEWYIEQELDSNEKAWMAMCVDLEIQCFDLKNCELENKIEALDKDGQMETWATLLNEERYCGANVRNKEKIKEFVKTYLREKKEKLLSENGHATETSGISPELQKRMQEVIDWVKGLFRPKKTPSLRKFADEMVKTLEEAAPAMPAFVIESYVEKLEALREAYHVNEEKQLEGFKATDKLYTKLAEIPFENVTRHRVTDRVDAYLTELDRAEAALLKTAGATEKNQQLIVTLNEANKGLSQDVVCAEEEFAKIIALKKQAREQMILLAQQQDASAQDFADKAEELKHLETQEVPLKSRIEQSRAQIENNQKEIDAAKKEIEKNSGEKDKLEQIRAKRKSVVEALNELINSPSSND